MAAPLVVLTGASGSGKTTIARIIEKTSPAVEVLFFDSIGVPSFEAMVAEYGSGEAWQRAMTLQWFERMRLLQAAGKPVLFEGQMRIAFVKEALQASRLSHAHVVLVDCSDAVRTIRLHGDRNQPDLANPVMTDWARFLREEAIASGIEILDTSYETTDGAASHVAKLLGDWSKK